MDKGSSVKTYILFSIVVVVVFIIGFVAGTIAGFRTAVHQLSQCTQVPCESIGVQQPTTTSCEICPQGGIRLLKGDG
jgi:hypothetical protein